ncbi:magnesium chelatase accessory protein [Rhizobium sp. RU20A]|uniref:alpha/beta fold hydrolase n=1 Tax=Rhizobium sp. RU20A TaxID=1907412 RepID=UPI000953AA66|nr:alpha/beta fold hydrolase [Rhizobium sp. RU20A]SIR42711.1 magnesium chelatase accessory protein [Rhizobium sp. RU20A]
MSAHAKRAPSPADHSLDWCRDGQDWPHREHSRFVEAGGLSFHVQVAGPHAAPVLLLLHGTGAASHSWRHVQPILARRFRLVVPDLPCHGFTRPMAGMADLSLPGMTAALAALLAALAMRPASIIGHSAGGAIAVSLATALGGGEGGGPGGRSAGGEERRDAPAVIAINGAFLPIRGDRLFSPIAKALFSSRLSARMFSLLARATPLGGNLVGATGSAIDPKGADLYRRLLASSGHVRGALGMMASWDLQRFDRLLSTFSAPLTLIAADDDPMVPAAHSAHAARLAPSGRLVRTPTGGHLLHEAAADTVCRMIETALEAERPAGVDAA